MSIVYVPIKKMTNEQLTERLKEMKQTGLFKQASHFHQALFFEAIKRLEK